MNMKSTRARSGSRFSEGLGSLRLTVVLLFGIIALFALATFLPQESGGGRPLEEIYSASRLTFLRMLGLTDVLRSGWFISMLVLLVLNLLAGVIPRLRAAWEEAGQKNPGAVNIKQITSARKSDKYLYVELNSSIAREEFREIISKWGRSRIGKPLVLRDEGGLNELQLAAHEGRFSRILMLIGHLALVLILAGVVVSLRFGFQGQFSVDEGARAGVLKIQSGNTQDWPVHRELGREVRGFYEPGFAVELEKFDIDRWSESAKPRSIRSWISFYQGDEKVKSAQIAVNEPVSFSGMRFFQDGYAKTGRLRVNLVVEDRKEEFQRRLPRLERDQAYALENDASFEILEVREQLEGMGAAAKIQYREGAKEPESFWIFQRYPAFDAASRKRSRHIFMVEGVTPVYTSRFKVVKDPGLPLVLIGTMLFLLSLLFSLFKTHNRYWFSWSPGRITLVGNSNRLFVFESKFERVARDCILKLGRKDKALRSTAWEVRNGAG